MPIAPLYNGNRYICKEEDKIKLLADNFEKIYNSNSNMGTINNNKKIVRETRNFLKKMS